MKESLINELKRMNVLDAIKNRKPMDKSTISDSLEPYVELYILKDLVEAFNNHSEVKNNCVTVELFTDNITGKILTYINKDLTKNYNITYSDDDIREAFIVYLNNKLQFQIKFKIMILDVVLTPSNKMKLEKIVFTIENTYLK